jgi:hypothetical protein
MATKHNSGKRKLGEDARYVDGIRRKAERTLERKQHNNEEIARKLNEERKKKESDLVLEVPEKGGIVEVHMHKLLAPELLTLQTCEQISEQRTRAPTRQARIRMTDQFQAWVVRALVDFLYASELPADLTCETAAILLRAADFHRIPDMTEALCEWLLLNMETSDAVFVFATAGELCKLSADPPECLKEVSTKAMRIIASNVLSLLYSGSLDPLPTIVEDLRFIASEYLALVVAKRIARNGHIEPLLKVDFGAFSKATLAREVKCLTSAGLMSPELQRHVLFSATAMEPQMTRTYGLEGAIVCVARDGNMHALVRGPTEGSYEACELPPIFPQTQVIGAILPSDHSIRVVIDDGKIVVVMFYGERRHVYSYDPETATWCYNGKTENNISDSAVAVTTEGVALLGGSIDGEDAVRWCEIRSKSIEGPFWARMPDLPVDLAGACALPVDGKVFVVGGQNGSAPSSGVLVHALGGEGFTHIGNLGEARWDFAAVLVDSPDGADGPVIYCFGGAGLLRSESGSSCEAFDVRKKKSHKLTDAPIEKKKIHSAWHRGGNVIEVVAGNMLLEYSTVFDSWTIVSRDVPPCAKAVRFP